jgi:hypothetical protein
MITLQKMSVEKWDNLLNSLGMFYESKRGQFSLFFVTIRRNGGGLASQGSGETLQEAIYSAAMGQNIDWFAAQDKIDKKEWEAICHL